MRDNLGPKKYPRENILDPWNTQRKTFELKKYPRKKFLDPPNTHGKKFRIHESTMVRWHDNYDTRPTTAHETQNLAYSLTINHIITAALYH